MTQLRRVAIVNRGEAAMRLIHAVRELSTRTGEPIETIALHTDGERTAMFVREADHSYALGPASARPYLDHAVLERALRETRADAAWVGWGFVAEDATFAELCERIGVTFVGPTPAAMRDLGDKIASKIIAERAGVPVAAWSDGPLPDLATALEHAARIGYPMMLKAAAGGGGRGIRVVRSDAELTEVFDRTRDEALRAFGSDVVFLERLVTGARHVEVQLIGDGQGAAWALGVRDCSVQRRNQKVIEESASVALDAEQVALLKDSAARLALAVGYRGAGTAEFLYQPDERTFAFLEVNTRLQVEHPVTEMTHQVDLVAEQIAVAEGGDGTDVVAGAQGHAIEVRLYAEDPAAGYRPQTGMLVSWDIPESDGIRVDAGYASGDEVSTHYDAMLAKVVAWAGTREEAVRKLIGTLRRARIHGVTTNRDQLLAVLGDERFVAGDVSTAFLDDLVMPRRGHDDGAPVAAALALAEHRAAGRRVQRGIPVAWRNVPSQPQRTEFEEVTVEWWGGRDGYTVDGFTVVVARPDRVTLEHDAVRASYDVAVAGDHVHVDSPYGHRRFTLVPRFTDPASQHASGSLLAPMPGTVVAVHAAVGDSVDAGQPVLVLEAMKMQHAVNAPHAGVVTEIDVAVGRQVAAGDVLAVVQHEAEGDPS